MKPIYTFLGLPASGKGTQAEIFAKERGFSLIGVGDLIREEIEANPSSEIVGQIEKKYDKGIPQSDSVIFSLIKKKLKDINNGVVFDNFPFSEAQANFITDLEKEGWKEPTIIYINIAPETAIKRISQRRICPNCGEIYKNNEVDCSKCKVKLETRSDDDEEIVKTRIKYYEPRLKEMLSFYNKKGKVVEIDGEPSISEVTKQIETIK